MINRGIALRNRASSSFIRITTVNLLYFIAIGYYLPILTHFLHLRGISDFLIGIINAISYFASSISQTIIGNIADKRGKISFIVIGNFISAIALFLLTFSSSFFEITIALILSQIITVVPLINALLIEISDLNKRGESFGKFRISGSIGWIIGTILGGIQSEIVSIESLFFTASGLFILTAILAKVLLFEVKTEKEVQVEKRSLILDMKKIFEERNFILFLVSSIIYMIVNTALGVFLPRYMEYYTQSPFWITFPFAFAAISEIPLMIYSGRLSDKIGRKVLITFGLMVLALRIFLYTLATNIIMILAISLLNGITFGTVYVVSVAYVSDLTPEGLHSTSQSVYNITISLATVIGSFLGGYLAELYGVFGLFRIIAFISLLDALFFHITVREANSK